MYEQGKDINCPVKSLEKYLSKLNPNCNRFFYQRPKSKHHYCDDVWYDNVPVGKNTLSTKMKKLSQAAGCTRLYTNHCVRATTITTLSRAGIFDHDICYVSGHRSKESLSVYKAKPTSKKRLEIITMLHDYSSVPACDLFASAAAKASTMMQAPRAATEVSTGSVSVDNNVNLSIPSAMRQDNQASFFVWKLFLWYRKRTFQINCQWTMSISMDCLQLCINQPDVWIVNTKAVIPNEMCQRCKYVYWLCLVRPPMLFWEHSIRREELRTAT